MLKVATLASGSSGNCAVVSDGKIHILLDAGTSARRIDQGLRELGLEARELSAVLITHEHSDHISALPVLCRQLDVELYATQGTALQICRRIPGIEDRFRVFDPGEHFALDRGQLPHQPRLRLPRGLHRVRRAQSAGPLHRHRESDPGGRPGHPGGEYADWRV